MLSDSDIAKHLKCAKTKKHSNIDQAIAPEIEHTMVGKMQPETFSLLTEDITDVTTKQQCCLLV